MIVFSSPSYAGRTVPTIAREHAFLIEGSTARRGVSVRSSSFVDCGPKGALAARSSSSNPLPLFTAHPFGKFSHSQGTGYMLEELGPLDIGIALSH